MIKQRLPHTSRVPSLSWVSSEFSVFFPQPPQNVLVGGFYILNQTAPSWHLITPQCAPGFPGQALDPAQPWPGSSIAKKNTNELISQVSSYFHIYPGTFLKQAILLFKTHSLLIEIFEELGNFSELQSECRFPGHDLPPEPKNMTRAWQKPESQPNRTTAAKLEHAKTNWSTSQSDLLALMWLKGIKVLNLYNNFEWKKTSFLTKPFVLMKHLKIFGHILKLGSC